MISHSLLFDAGHEPLCEGSYVLPIVHLVDYLPPVYIFDRTTRLYCLAHLTDLPFTLEVVFFSEQDLKEISKSILYMELDEPEFFVTFVF